MTAAGCDSRQLDAIQPTPHGHVWACDILHAAGGLGLSFLTQMRGLCFQGVYFCCFPHVAVAAHQLAAYALGFSCPLGYAHSLPAAEA